MKRIIAAFFIVGLGASFACAEWRNDFKDDYKNKSVDVAVENAMKQGINPERIVEHGISYKNIQPQHLVKSLYSAGVPDRDIYHAAQQHHISDSVIKAGFNEWGRERGDHDWDHHVADTHPSDPGRHPGHDFDGHNYGEHGRPYASPSCFNDHDDHHKWHEREYPHRAWERISFNNHGKDNSHRGNDHNIRQASVEQNSHNGHEKDNHQETWKRISSISMEKNVPHRGVEQNTSQTSIEQNSRKGHEQDYHQQTWERISSISMEKNMPARGNEQDTHRGH